MFWGDVLGRGQHTGAMLWGDAVNFWVSVFWGDAVNFWVSVFWGVAVEMGGRHPSKS